MKAKIGTFLFHIFYWITIILAYVCLTMATGVMWLLGSSRPVHTVDKVVFGFMSIGILLVFVLAKCLFPMTLLWIVVAIPVAALFAFVMYLIANV